MGAKIEGETDDGGTDICRDLRNSRDSCTGKWADETGRGPVQVTVPAESRSDLITHGFWKRGTTTMLDEQITNLNAGSSYLCMNNR